MKRFFDEELETFKADLTRMKDLALRQVTLAAQAFRQRDTVLAARVVAGDDELDRFEIAMDAAAIRYITLRAPVAGELRVIIAGMKASHDLERVGDEAWSIARRTGKLPPGLDTTPAEEKIVCMAQTACWMLEEAFVCFAGGDTEHAWGVIAKDDTVDAMNREIYRDFSERMAHCGSVPLGALEFLFIAKSVERIADHAVNIAEEMVFLHQAGDIRHQS